MVIGIEAQRIFRKRKFGIDRVSIALINYLQKIDHTNQYYIFVKSGPDNNVITEKSNFKIITLPKVSYPIWEQLYLPKAVLKYKCDILHCTSGTAPLKCNIPILLTLHDVIFLEKSYLKILLESSRYYNKFGNIYRKIITPFSVKKSHKIITVSEFEKKQIQLFFPMLKQEKIKVIYNGVNKSFQKKDSSVKIKKVIAKFNLSNNYFFFISGKDPRKNIKNTLRGFHTFKKRNDNEVKIVILHHKKSEIKRLLKAIKCEKLWNSIILIDYVSNSEIRILYKLSTLFLYTSMREGFGIPILEAMSCGTPVITSNCSSMPEISGTAAHLINPNDAENISEGMDKIYNETEYRKYLIKQGLNRYPFFSWELMATEIRELYFKY